ncbi:hypothetical protein ACHAXT_011100 [Thalassiosira profunda]
MARNYDTIIDEEEASPPPRAIVARTESGGGSLSKFISPQEASILTSLGIQGKGGKSSTTTTPSCSFSECYASNCNHKVAPYTCLFHNGGPHGGCSSTPWVLGSCTTKSCDLSHCAGLDIPEGTDNCDKPCKKEICIGDRLCDSDAPYQCTSGSAAFGCSAGKFEWTLKTSSQTCSGCCDAGTCKKD